MLPEPAVAVTVPPHDPLRPFGVATTRFVGRVSVNATPVSATVLAAGLVMVKVSAETPLGTMAAGTNTLLITGGATTKMLADAVPPVIGRKVADPSSNVALMWPLTLFLVPAVVPVTLTENEQELAAGKFSEVKLMELVPELAAISDEATQLPVRPLGFATTSPVGNVSLNAMPTNGVDEFGLAMLKVSEVVPFNGMLAAPNALFTVGAWTTSRVAVFLSVPGPLSLAEIGPVGLDSVPVPVTSRFTVTTHVPLAIGPLGTICRFAITGGGPCGARLPPEKLIEDDPATAVTVPPQVLLAWLGVATTRPAGKLSVNEIPVSVTVELELLMVKLTATVLFCATEDAEKSL